MAAAFVKATLLSSGSGNNVSGSVSSTAGDLLVACASSFGASAFSGSGGGTWTADATITAQNADAAILSCPNTTGGAQTITVTATSAAIGVTVAVHEYSGMATAAPLDSSAPAGASGTSTTATSPSETNVTADAVFVAMMGIDVGNNPTTMTGTASGWTYSYVSGTEQMKDTDGSAHEPFASGYKVVAATGTESSVWTCDSGAWVALIACYKGTGAAAAPPPRRQRLLMGVGL